MNFEWSEFSDLEDEAIPLDNASIDAFRGLRSVVE